jgi:hypothetical protein
VLATIVRELDSFEINVETRGAGLIHGQLSTLGRVCKDSMELMNVVSLVGRRVCVHSASITVELEVISWIG